MIPAQIGLDAAFGGNLLLLLLNIFFFVGALLATKLAWQTRNRFLEKYDGLLDSGSKEIKTLLQTSSQKIVALIDSVNLDTQQTRTEFHTHLEGLAQRTTTLLKKSEKDLQEDYNQFLAQAQIDLKKKTEQMLTSVSTQAGQEMQKLVQTLKEETSKTQAGLHDQLQKEFSEALSQVQSFREEQLTLVEKSINKIILKVSQRVLSKAISPVEHEKLIFEALERAKQEESIQGYLSELVSTAKK